MGWIDWIGAVATAQSEAASEAAGENAEAVEAAAEEGSTLDVAGAAERLIDDPEGAVSTLVEAGTALAIEYGPKIALALLVLVFGYMLSGWAKRIVTKATGKARVEPTLTKFFGNLAKYLVLVMVLISTVSTLGIEVASFAAILAAAGFAIGLAFQGTLSNFSAGVMLLIFRPFKIGQWITVAGTSGTVDAIDLFTTTIDTLDNHRVIIPNSNVFGNIIENFGHNAHRQVIIEVGVEYPANIDQTRAVLEAAADSVEGQVAGKGKTIMLAGLGASSVDWSVRIWCDAPSYWGVREALLRAVKMHLDEAGIGIPFPQMDVHLDGAVHNTHQNN